MARLVLIAVLAGCGGSNEGGARDAGPRVDAGPASLDSGAADAGAGCRGVGAPRMETHAYAEIDGVDPNLLSLDVYVTNRPDGCPPAPVMLWVHGGGWALGDKANQVADKIALFSAEGWLFASTNYRLSPTEPTTDPAAVRYPIHEQDVAAAFAWLRERAGSFGADPERIYLMGHSAGAGIVSLLATDPQFLDAHGLALADVRCAAMLDTEAYDVRAQCESGNRIYLNAFGDDPAVWDEASALSHVIPGAGIAPSFVVTRGGPARVALSRRFVDALTAAGIPATLVDASPLTHEGVNDAVGAPSDTIVTPPLMEFLATCRP